jgi:hypothetical protein
MEYKIVVTVTLSDLVTLVNQDIQDGWDPQGGVAVTVSLELGVFTYYQAMVKRPLKEW